MYPPTTTWPFNIFLILLLLVLGTGFRKPGVPGRTTGGASKHTPLPVRPEKPTGIDQPGKLVEKIPEDREPPAGNGTDTGEYNNAATTGEERDPAAEPGNQATPGSAGEQGDQGTPAAGHETAETAPANPGFPAADQGSSVSKAPKPAPKSTVTTEKKVGPPPATIPAGKQQRPVK